MTSLCPLMQAFIYGVHLCVTLPIKSIIFRLNSNLMIFLCPLMQAFINGVHSRRFVVEKSLWKCKAWKDAPETSKWNLVAIRREFFNLNSKLFLPKYTCVIEPKVYSNLNNFVFESFVGTNALELAIFGGIFCDANGDFGATKMYVLFPLFPKLASVCYLHPNFKQSKWSKHPWWNFVFCLRFSQ